MSSSIKIIIASQTHTSGYSEVAVVIANYTLAWALMVRHGYKRKWYHTESACSLNNGNDFNLSVT